MLFFISDFLTVLKKKHISIVSETKIRDVVHEAENSIIVKKIPIAYFYPFSLWPLPKAFPTSKGELFTAKESFVLFIIF